MKATVKLKMKVPVEIFKKGGDFIGYCPLFDVASQGETKQEAKHNIAEALSAFLIACYKMGTLDEVLKESGFVPVSDDSADNCLDAGLDYIDVPLPLIASNQTLNECHA